jgi:hypothetical protein
MDIIPQSAQRKSPRKIRFAFQPLCPLPVAHMLLLVEAEAAAAVNWRGGHRPQRDLGYQQTAGFSIRARILPDAAVWILLISRPAWAPDRRSRRPDAIPHQAPLRLRQDEPCGGCFPARWHQTRHAGFISGSAAVSTFPFFSFGDGVRHGKDHVNSSRRCAAKITWHHRYQVSESVLISSSYLRCTLLEKIKIEAEEDLTERKPNSVGTVDLQDRIEGKVWTFEQQPQQVLTMTRASVFLCAATTRNCGQIWCLWLILLV